MSLALDDCRRFPRIAAALRGSLSAAGETRPIRCTNLSRGGAFVATRWLLPEGAIVDLDIGGVMAIGRVVRTRTRPAGMGIEFLDVDAAGLSRLGCPAGERRAPAVRSSEIVVVGAAAARLRDHGHRVVSARSARRALLLCLERRPDLLICDAPFAGELLPMVRVPALCVSSGRRERLRALRLGADAVADADSVVEVAEYVLGMRRPRRPFRGTLAQVPLSRVLAVLEHERQTGILVLVGGRFEFMPAPLPTPSPQRSHSICCDLG
jgi:hypothetical protein